MALRPECMSDGRRDCLQGCVVCSHMLCTMRQTVASNETAWPVSSAERDPGRTRRSQLSLCSAAYALSVQHGSDNVNEHRILAVTSVGLPTNLLLGYFSWIVVRHRTLRTCAAACTAGRALTTWHSPVSGLLVSARW